MRHDTCPSIETLSDFSDRSLPIVARWRVRRHLAHCPDCARRLAAEGQLWQQTFASVQAPPRMRRAVLGAVVATPATRIVRTPRVVGISAALAASVLLFAAIGRVTLEPRIAFAQVEAAMRQIHTAQWQETISSYSTRERKATQGSMTKMVRLSPPALRTDFGGKHVALLRPDMLRVYGVTQGPGSVNYIGPSGSGFVRTDKIDKGQKPRSAAAMLQEDILQRLMAPGGAGGSRVGWQSSEDTIEGRRVLRFDSGIGRGARQANRASRLTAPGYRQILWADPQTRRVVRTQHEYYDGMQHTIVTGTGFVYDQPIAAELFAGEKDRSPKR